MKSKKKSNQIKSTNLIKLLNIKTTQQPEKNHKSTKQKTFVTIEENLQTYENPSEKNYFSKRYSLNNITKKNYIERMQQNNLSPFSNDGRSVSPRLVRTPEKINKQQKQIKLTLNLKNQQKKKTQKNKILSARSQKQSKCTQKQSKKVNKSTLIINSNNNIQAKKKPQTKKKANKYEQFTQKQQKARIQFQNQFLSMMNKRILNKKITQKSIQDEYEHIIRNKPKLLISIDTQENVKKNRKQQIVKTMKIKVMKTIQHDYPNLQVQQKKVMCAIIIIQRLWRQRKVKMFFQHYVTPKSSPNTSLRDSFINNNQNSFNSNNNSTFNILNTNKQFIKKPVDLILTQKDKSIIKQYENNFLIRQKSSQSFKYKNQQSLSKQSSQSEQKQKNQLIINNLSLNNQNLHDLQTQNQKIILRDNLDRPSLLKFLQCYREIKLKKSKTKKNVFSLRQSLSQKCLMQKYYSNIFNDKPQKDQPKNYQIFSTLKQNQKSIQLFKEINKQQEKYKEIHCENNQQKQNNNNNNNNNQQKLQQQIFKQNNQQQLHQQQLKKNQITIQQQQLVRYDTNCSQQNDSQQLERKRIQKINKKIIVDQTQGFSPLSKRVIRQQQKQINNCNQKQQIQQKQVEQNQNDCGLIVNKKPQQQLPSQPKSSQIIQPSLKSIQSVSQSLIQSLMTQFSLQFKSFTQKKCLTKKHKQKKQQKKSRLPGIQITSSNISSYLSTLISCIFQLNKSNITKSFQIFKPQLYIKCHRSESIIYEIFQYDEDYEDDEEEYYWNVVSNEAFFKCEEIYQEENMKINKDNQKFKNFIQLTMKIHNRSLSDSFSELLNKALLEKTVHPWSFFAKNNKKQNKFIFDQYITQNNQQFKHISINQLANNIKTKITKQSFLKVGSLKKKSQQIEQKKLLKMIYDEYIQQGNQWQVYDQIYQLKSQLSQYIFQNLMTEIQNELVQFHSKILTKSQNQIFLQTNETLETTHNM